MRSDDMPKPKRADESKPGKRDGRTDRPGARSSPGSGEDDDEAADLQPDDVEDGSTAR
jgi:hypothetical protein